jgi:hypothetical protein
MFNRIIAACSVLGLAGAVVLAAEQPYSARAIVPLFDAKVISINVPPGFVPGYEEKRGPQYIMELIDAHGTLSDWSEMITLKGWRGSSVDPKSSTRDLLFHLLQGIQGACKETFAVTRPESFEVDRIPAIRVIAGCGTVHFMPAKSEVAVISVFQVDGDFYSVQRAFRGAHTEKPPQIDAQSLIGKFQQLGPIKICEHGNASDPAYDSCIHPRDKSP